MAERELANLEQLLDAASEAGDGSKMASVDDLLDSVGHRSFGPLLLILALVAFTPLGGIPGLPTVLAAMVILVAAQLVVGKKRFWPFPHSCSDGAWREGSFRPRSVTCGRWRGSSTS